MLLISDEVICSWGRLGEFFGAERFGYQPDIITTAKGITSAYAPMGAVIASDRLVRAVLRGHATRSSTASRSPGTRWPRPSRWPTSTVFEEEGILENVREHEGAFRAMLDSLRDIPIVGDVRGAGYFHAIELVKDRETKATLHRRGVRDAAARLPLRRAVPPRADLPRRRPRRPGDPALAAADRRPRALRGDRGRSCARCSRRRRGGAARSCSQRPTRAHAHRPRHARRPRRPARWPASAASTRRCAGCTSPSSPTRRRGCRAASCC